MILYDIYRMLSYNDIIRQRDNIFHLIVWHKIRSEMRLGVGVIAK